jgi:hypothetical protein
MMLLITNSELLARKEQIIPKVVINGKTPKIACPGDFLLIYHVGSLSKFDWVVFDRAEDFV